MGESRRKRYWVVRSLGAFLASLVTVVVLSVGTDTVLRTAGVFPPIGQPNNNSRLLAIAFAYRLVYSVLGAYIIARLAPFAPMTHALVSGALGTVIATIGVVSMWNYGPNWYPVALAVTAMPCAWLGASIEDRLHGT